MSGPRAEAGAGPHPGAVQPVYPLVVTGRLDQPSRWRWLVKWLLTLPHYLILLGLWLLVCVAAAAAGVTMVCGGDYPRSLFAFNRGVMRWSWRVSFYAYGVGGTDRYPPFTLGAAPGYPADLWIDYPSAQRHGPGLVLAWLAGLPQYLVAGILLGAGGILVWPAPWLAAGGIGLIGLLALTALVGLLAGRQYPASLYELLLGLNRWVLRVLAYAAMLTPVYPPFRLDPGEYEPPAPAPAPAPAPDVADRAP